MPRTLLIDADVLVYEAGRATEYEFQWDDDLWTLHGNMQSAIAHFDDRITCFMRDLEADAVALALSDYTNPWRKGVMPTYKSNRKAVRKPVTYGPLREYAHEKYDTYQRPGLEGDDILGVLMTHPNIIPGEKVLVSIDKDMQTIPGEHYNQGKLTRFSVSPAGADYYHFLQTLTGDTTDGYPGCPGLGAKRAAPILEPFYTGDAFDTVGAWQAVVEQYEKKGLSEAVALENARVARICRHTDYDFKTKQVRLWTPPKG